MVVCYQTLSQTNLLSETQSVKYTYIQYIARCWNSVYGSFDLTIKTLFCDEGDVIFKGDMTVNFMMALLCDKKTYPPKKK